MLRRSAGSDDMNAGVDTRAQDWRHWERPRPP